MKITKYLCCTLACMCLLKVANTEVSRDKFEQQLLDALAEKTIKSKRPFCNAFTGCGRFVSEEKRVKKKATSTPRDLSDFRGTSDNVQLPVSLYRALLNAAKQNVWKAMDQLRAWEYSVRRTPDCPPPLRVYPRNLPYKEWPDPKYEIVDPHARLSKIDLIPGRIALYR